MPKVCPKYAQDMAKIFQRYASSYLALSRACSGKIRHMISENEEGGGGGWGGQRPFGSFPKTHPLWQRHPSLRWGSKRVQCSPSGEYIYPQCSARSSVGWLWSIVLRFDTESTQPPPSCTQSMHPMSSFNFSSIKKETLTPPPTPPCVWTKIPSII